jgi:tRNA (guanine-N7-)-methyltransferase
MRTKFKPWTLEYLNEHKNKNIDIEKVTEIVFLSPIYLEVGSGKGGFITTMAKNNPKTVFLGIEKNITCAGITCKKIIDSELENAFIVSEDVEKVFDSIPDSSLDGIFLNFSDPWPKLRHAKRRLTAPRFLDNYYRILKKDSRLYFKSDNENLFSYSLKMIKNDKRFKLISVDENYDGKCGFDAQTEYEKSFRELGQNIYRIIAEKE